MLFTVSGASSCRWGTTDAGYSAMVNSCASTSSCTFTGATTNLSAYTYYIACADAAGNENGAADNLHVSWTNNFLSPPSVSALGAAPAAMNQLGSGTTTLTCDFSDADVPPLSDFRVTLRVRQPDDTTIVTLCDSVAGGGGRSAADGAGTLSLSGSNPYSASVAWNPGDALPDGAYDLECTVTDGGGAGVSGSSDFAANANELTFDSSPPSGFAITSVAGDTTAPYIDYLDEAPNTTVALFTVSSASSCRWGTTDISYSAMTSGCASTSSCTFTGATSSAAYTYYIACTDAAGNENGATDNLDVSWTNSFVPPPSKLYLTATALAASFPATSRTLATAAGSGSDVTTKVESNGDLASYWQFTPSAGSSSSAASLPSAQTQYGWIAPGVAGTAYLSQTWALKLGYRVGNTGGGQGTLRFRLTKVTASSGVVTQLAVIQDWTSTATLSATTTLAYTTMTFALPALVFAAGEYPMLEVWAKPTSWGSGVSSGKDWYLEVGTANDVLRPYATKVTQLSASPSAVSPVGSGTTTVGCVFTNLNADAASTFDVTLSARQPDGVTVITLCSAKSDGEACAGPGAGTLSVTGSLTYTAQVTWNPDDVLPEGFYDLQCTVTDTNGTGDTDTSTFALNPDKLELDATPPGSFAITSVAGDTSAPYVDAGDEAPNTTTVVFSVSGASACRWGAADLAYSAMVDDCASTSSCIFSDATLSAAYTYHIACVDLAGNGNSSTDNLDVAWTNEFGLPDTSVTSGPARYTNDVNDTSFAFSATGGVEFSYALDSGAWSAWSGASGVTLGAVASGVHTLEVKARNGSGTEDPTPATYVWRVDSTPVTIDLATQEVDYWLYGAAALDFFGASVATGDVDASGIDDLIASAPNAEGALAESSAGRVYVKLGQASYTGGADLAAGGASMVVTGVSAYDQLGSAVAADDVDGDSCKDLVMSAPAASALGRSQAGVVYVLMGRRAGGGCAIDGALPASWDLASAPADVTIYGAAANDYTGFSVATADINGDGYADVLIDAERADPGGRSEAGVVYVVFGRESWPVTVDLNAVGSAMRVYGSEADDRLRVAGGTDMTGDGAAELLILAYQADGPSNSRPNAGEAYVISGGAGRDASTTVDLSVASPDTTIYAGASGDALWAMGSGGNFNGDLSGTSQPLNDIVLGARGASGGKGVVYVVYGASTLPATVDLGASGWDVRLTGSAAGEGSGANVLLEDVNGDGLADVVATAATSSWKGEVLVLYGTEFESGAKVDSTPSEVWPNQPSWRLRGRTTGEIFGGALAGGNLDGDGVRDLFVGALFSSGNASIPSLPARDLCGEAHIRRGVAE